MTTMQSAPTQLQAGVIFAGQSLGDALDRLGEISPRRIRMKPSPGMATERDVIQIRLHERRLYELIDGFLVEKVMGYRESLVAVEISTAIRNFVKSGNLGAVSGADGMISLFPGLVRIPDVAFTSKNRFIGGKITSEAIPKIAPDLVVEVLSEGNTETEMRLKRSNYFDAGVKLVWMIDPASRTASIYSSPDHCTVIGGDQPLEGADVLPGFKLPLKDVFSVFEL